jgi:sulfur-carrier protein
VSGVRVDLRLHGTLKEHTRTPHHVLPVDVADGATLRDLFDHLAERRPALERAIRDETGTVRQHINVFVDGEHVRDRRSAAPAR